MASNGLHDAHGARPVGAPLSFAQQRLWFLNQLIPLPEAYNVPGVYEVHGDLNEQVLRRALAELMRRHEPLRAAIVEVGGRPEQRVHAAGTIDVPLVVHDLTGVPGSQRAQRIRAVADEQVPRAFDLGRPPLWRVDLLRLAAQEHVLLITLHHIVADGWSLPIMLDELTRTYAAAVEGGQPAPGELPTGYADFARWQRERLSGSQLDELTGYWREALRGAPAVLALPSDRARPAVASYRGDAVEFVVPDDLRQAVSRLSRRLRASPFILLLAAFAALLHRYTRQGDIVVGSPTAGRTHVEHEELIGFFANTLPLRVDCAGDPSFGELVARARATTLSALDHGELPFDRIVAALDPTRDLSHHPIFQVLFAMTGLPPDWAAPGLRITSLPPFRNGTAKFDLALMFFEEGERLTGTAEFTTDLFDRATIERLVTHLLTLTRAAVDAPAVPLSRLPMLEPAERDAIIALSTGPVQPYPERTLHALFERQVRRTPDAPAVITEAGRCDYRTLNARANRLARHLRRLGVRPDSPVAIGPSRGTDLAVAVLAALKAGGVAVPLGPGVDSDAGTLDLTGVPDEDLPDVVTPDHIAHLRDGLAVTHRSLVNQAVLRTTNRRVRLASLSTTPEISEAFSAWLSGDAVELTADAPPATKHVPRPPANTRFHVLDPNLRPVPVGVPGELYLGGVEPGRGYPDRPDRTAERFVPDPFGPPGARLFRTGDLVRLRGDGTIEPTDRPPDEPRAHPTKPAGGTAARTPVEAAMAGIWRAVLGLDEVGIHDNFFELGGHSLLAMQIIARCRAAFAVDLSLTTLFELPTIAGLCTVIETGAAAHSPTSQLIPRRTVVPLEEATS